MDPTVLDSSTDESELEQRERQERDDNVDELDNFSSPNKFKKTSSLMKGSPTPNMLVNLADSDSSSKPGAD